MSCISSFNIINTTNTNPRIQEIADQFPDHKLLKTASKVEAIFANCLPEHPKPHCLYPLSNDKYLLFYENDWELYSKTQGAFLKVFIGKTKVIKTPLKSSAVSDYLKERGQLKLIYDDIGTNNIGIQPPTSQPDPLPPLTEYDFAKKQEKPLSAYHIEFPYNSTLQSLIPKEGFTQRLNIFRTNTHVSSEETLSICASLVQGSKVFFQKEIIPLDVKPLNIGYLGNGQAEHFDFSNPIFVYRANQRIGFNNKLTKQERFHMFLLVDAIKQVKPSKETGSLSKPDKQRELFSSYAKSLHIKELGIVFKKLTKDCKDLSPDQQAMITKMSASSENTRPEIEAVELVFPKTFILPKE